MAEPRWDNNCNKCIFIGACGEYDLYACKHVGADGGVVLFNADGTQHVSEGDISSTRLPGVQKALKRAIIIAKLRNLM